jgi:DNA-binding CsgD family transcriptional regulator/tetratricopeptide (TPR) repeat protein
MKTLSDEAVGLLRLAAVIGRRFDFQLLQHLTGLSEAMLLAQLRALVQAQLVVEESADVFVFRHALTREAVYRDLLERERLTLHRQVLGGLEALYPEAKGDRVMADLAFHAYQSGTWAKAMNYAQAAGQQAQALHAPLAAIEHFTYAMLSAQRLNLVPPPGLYRARGQMHELLGQFEPACSDYKLALATARQLRDTAAECQGLLDLGFLWTGRDYTRAGALFDEAVALVRPVGQAALLATTLNRVGLWHTHAERPLEGLRHHAEALAVYRGEGNQAGQAETLDLLGVTAYMAGDLSLGWRFFEEGIAACRQTGDRQRLATLLFTGALRGGGLLVDTLAWVPVPSTVCLQACVEAIQITQDIPSPADEAYAHIIYAHVLGNLGELGAALNAAQTALELSVSIEHGMWTMNAQLVLGALYLELLQADLALPYLASAPAQARALGSTYMTFLATSCLSRCYMALKQTKSAANCLGDVLAPALDCQTLAQRLVWAAEGEQRLMHAQWADALEVADLLIAATQSSAPAQAIGMTVEPLKAPPPRLSLSRAQALAGLGRVAEAMDACQAAIGTAAAFGALPALWRAQSTLAGLQRAAGDCAAAVEAREAALATIDGVAASLDKSDPTRERFRTAAIARLPVMRPPSARALARRRFDGLTPRQVDIARRVAEGQPNHAIAMALTLSERTVEKHVENILAKLGFKTRTQIAGWAVKKHLLGGAS